MSDRVKRTYNLRPRTLARVRELASSYGPSTSQDAVVELAVDRLFREVREQQEAEVWSRAADDPEFRAEMRAIALDHGDRREWPA